jgi:hypothetical protein
MKFTPSAGVALTVPPTITARLRPDKNHVMFNSISFVKRKPHGCAHERNPTDNASTNDAIKEGRGSDCPPCPLPVGCLAPGVDKELLPASP